MELSRKSKYVVGIAALLAAAGGGAAAVAASQDTSPSDESKAIIDDAAGQLGISPDKLGNALKKALADRVDAAVAAGRITKAEGDVLKARIQAGDFPIIEQAHTPIQIHIRRRTGIGPSAVLVEFAPAPRDEFFQASKFGGDGRHSGDHFKFAH